LIFIISFSLKYALADEFSLPDPLIQYNQSGQPYVVIGGTTVGDYNNLNTSGEGLTYDIPEAQDGVINETIFHATFDGWSTVTNCTGSAAEGWSECTGEAVMYWRAVAGTASYNASSTQYHEGNDIDTANNTWITKCLDLSSYSKAYVTFWYNKTSTNAANERQFILFNKTGAGAFVSIWGSTTAAAAWTYQDLNITDHISSYTCIRYMAGAASIGTERLRLDDFKIKGERPVYKVEVWHNSSQIADGNILSINATVNFTTNVSDYYSLQIYDWLNSQWVSTECNSDNVLADTATQWWCNKTSNPMNYNSSDRIIRIRINSTNDTDIGLLKEDYVQYFVGYEAGYLEINLTNPDPSLPLSVIQNYTFDINATVTCRNGPCGEIFGTARYNLTSNDPDTDMNTTFEDKPFFIQETPASALKSCGVMYKDQICQLNWTVNATGDTNSYWKVGVLFNSSYPELQRNHTDNVTVSIISCTEDFNVTWNTISFGLLDPGSTQKPAQGNENNEYNISVRSGSCNLNLYIRGTDIVNQTLNSVIGVSNVTWSNTSNTYSSSYTLTKTDQTIKLNVPKSTNVTTWYWINLPIIYTGYYNGTITITGVKTG